MYADCNHGFSRTIPKNPQTEHVQKGTPADAPQRKDVSIMHNPSQPQLLHRIPVPRILRETGGNDCSFANYDVI